MEKREFLISDRVRGGVQYEGYDMTAEKSGTL